jgi:hypothetical protein
MGSDKFCTADCGADSDCGTGFKCTARACVPRAGSCKGTGTFCEPCHSDDECMSGLYCGATSVERVCLPPDMNCSMDTECPKSPSGLQGTCLNDPNSPGVHICVPPFFKNTSKYECWGANTGAPCGVNADCASGTCTGATTLMLGTCN